MEIFGGEIFCTENFSHGAGIFWRDDGNFYGINFYYENFCDEISPRVDRIFSRQFRNLKQVRMVCLVFV